MTQIDRAFFEHLGQFAGGDHVIHVADAVGFFAGQSGFIFLRDAGHNCHDHDVVRVDAHLLGIIGFDDGPGHLLRRLAGRGHVLQAGERMLQEVDPARAARGQNRQILVLLEAFDDLFRLFHHGQIRAESSIEDRVETKTMQPGDQFAGDRLARRHTEFFTNGHAHRRGHLHDDRLLGVEQRPPDFLNVTHAGQSRRRTDTHALTAEDAVRIDDGFFFSRSHHRVKTAAKSSQSAHGLYFIAHGLAAAAHNALIGIAL